MRPTRSAAALAALALSIACGRSRPIEDDANGPVASPPGERVASDALRVTTPAPPEDVAAVTAAHADFALDLHRALASTAGGNLFFSPQSLSFALSMTYAGAAGDTASAFRDTLRLDAALTEARYHRAMNDLDRQLESRGAGAAGVEGQPFRLRIVNQLFARCGFAFEAPFLDVLAQEYGADVRRLDFAAAPESARLEINAWVARATEDRIVDLLAPGIVETDTRAVLVNAIYFNAAWATRFSPVATTSQPFTLLDGSTASVPTMHEGALPVRAAQVSGIEVVELPYDGGEVSMVLLAPPSGGFAAFEQQLTSASLADLVAALRDETVSLSLPRFEVRTSASLEDPLAQLGLGVAFTNAADFSRMSTFPLKIEDVVHQAWVSVNEAGTEASAATGVVLRPTAAPVDPRPVAIDRPFLFLVLDRATGAIVFLGRVVDPRAAS